VARLLRRRAAGAARNGAATALSAHAPDAPHARWSRLLAHARRAPSARPATARSPD